jgi:molybdopterin/thiamine biosynthesis adenylyltransferase
MIKPKQLTDVERAVYEWQLDVPGFGEAGQERLKGASVLVSRTGGLGSVVAYELAAAGVGRLILAHGGEIRHSDLNRQLTMTFDALGTQRVFSSEKRLKELNPRLETVTLPENVSDKNVAELVAQADLIVDAAPLFEERFAMNREAVRQGKPLIECAMYELQAQITTVIRGKTPCLACLYPEPPPVWKRKFPVFGAVAGAVGCLGAMEAIKVLSGLGELLTGTLLTMDLRTMEFRRLKIKRRPDCPVCGSLPDAGC